MSLHQQPRMTMRERLSFVAAGALGVVIALVIWIGVSRGFEDGLPSSAGSVEGVVHDSLGRGCQVVDGQLLTRLFGAGAVKERRRGDRDTTRHCEWQTSSTTVYVDAERYTRRSGSEVENASKSFTMRREDAEEADPAVGLPIEVKGVGDEAYVVYGRGPGRQGEQRGVQVTRAGNVVITVTVRRSAKAEPLRRDEFVDRVRQVANAATDRLPD